MPSQWWASLLDEPPRCVGAGGLRFLRAWTPVNAQPVIGGVMLRLHALRVQLVRQGRLATTATSTAYSALGLWMGILGSGCASGRMVGSALNLQG